jgi:hypothetical protein
MESILKAIKKEKIPINPAIVISNKLDARGLKVAQNLGVKTEVIESKGFKGNRAEFDKKIISILTKNGVTPKNGLVCLAGFMRIISPEFVKNQHSSSFASCISRTRCTKTGNRLWCKIFRMYSTFCRFRSRYGAGYFAKNGQSIR